MKSSLEAMLDLQMTLSGLASFETEYRFDPVRKWRFDFAWPNLKIAAEVEGGAWSQGRHTRGAGFVGDCEKYNAALLAGWQVLRFTGDMILSGAAVEQIEQLIKQKQQELIA